MVSLGLCPPQSSSLQPWTCQDTRAEATELDLLPARCWAAALGEGAGFLWGWGRWDQAVLMAKHWCVQRCLSSIPLVLYSLSAQHRALKLLLFPHPATGGLAGGCVEERPCAWLEKSVSNKIHSLDPCARADPAGPRGGEQRRGSGALGSIPRGSAQRKGLPLCSSLPLLKQGGTRRQISPATGLAALMQT